jgi:hypothetical protein
MARTPKLRASALLAAGALAVHQLRYALSFHDAGRVLGAQGHAYLAVVMPLALGLLAAAGGLFLAGLTRAARGGAGAGAEPARAPGLGRLWVVASTILILTYAAQESLEGAIASGHPAGLAGVFGHGGAIAVPVALAVGALVALALRGAHAAIAFVARRRTPLPRGRAPRARRLPPRAALPALDPVARHLAGRGPPALSA